MKYLSNNICVGLNEYQSLAARTIDGTWPEDKQKSAAGLGISGEAGEVSDLIKKEICHGHPVDFDKIKKELGDVMWYVAYCATIYGLTLEDIASENIIKLIKRYPNGFTTEDSINRKD